MNTDEFLADFSYIANAPDGVDHLRKIILRFAVQGRLVSQQVGSSDASVDFPAYADVGVNSMSIPVGWLSVPFGELGEWRGGGTPSKSNSVFWSGDIPWVSPKDMKQNCILETQDQITEEAVAKSSTKLIPPGSILIVIRGMILIHTFPVAYAGCELTINQDMKSVIPAHPEVRDFTLLALNALNIEVLSLVERSSHGTCKLLTKDIKSFQIPIPPLEEQKLIVAKVNELMKLCDRLERQQQQRSRLLPLLSKANHARLLETPTSDSLATIFTAPPTLSPDDMRKTILALAIRGRLVTQDSNDSSVEELLDRIDLQRAEHSASRKSKSTAAFDRVDPSEVPYAIPTTWKWVKFGRIVVNRDGERIPLSKAKRAVLAKSYDYYGASGVIDKVDTFLFDKPLLLIGEDGANLINRSTPIAFLAYGKYWVNNHAHVLDGISEAFLQYIAIHINAINLEPYVTGTAQPKMNQAKMNSILIALPPLPEQERIVARVGQLMDIIGILEAKRNEADETAESFAKAVVASITGTQIPEQQDMKAPKTELVTRLTAKRKPTKVDNVPLAKILSKSKADVSAKELWQKSGLEIDAFYSQLKIEMSQGWITEPKKGLMKEVATN